ncbi:hypothetical protein CSKR_200081, partial [Clonorchis sinensis]
QMPSSGMQQDTSYTARSESPGMQQRSQYPAQMPSSGMQQDTSYTAQPQVQPGTSYSVHGSNVQQGSSYAVPPDAPQSMPYPPQMPFSATQQDGSYPGQSQGTGVQQAGAYAARSESPGMQQRSQYPGPPHAPQSMPYPSQPQVQPGTSYSVQPDTSGTQQGSLYAAQPESLFAHQSIQFAAQTQATGVQQVDSHAAQIPTAGMQQNMPYPVQYPPSGMPQQRPYTAQSHVSAGPQKPNIRKPRAPRRQQRRPRIVASESTGVQTNSPFPETESPPIRTLQNVAERRLKTMGDRMVSVRYVRHNTTGGMSSAYRMPSATITHPRAATEEIGPPIPLPGSGPEQQEVLRRLKLRRELGAPPTPVNEQGSQAPCPLPQPCLPGTQGPCPEPQPRLPRSDAPCPLPAQPRSSPLAKQRLPVPKKDILRAMLTRPLSRPSSTMGPLHPRPQGAPSVNIVAGPSSQTPQGASSVNVVAGPSSQTPQGPQMGTFVKRAKNIRFVRFVKKGNEGFSKTPEQQDTARVNLEALAAFQRQSGTEITRPEFLVAVVFIRSHIPNYTEKGVLSSGPPH